jgi:hypothetical protein
MLIRLSGSRDLHLHLMIYISLIFATMFIVLNYVLCAIFIKLCGLVRELGYQYLL